MKKILVETFARKMISLSGKEKTHGMREFICINDRLSTFLTQHGSEMAFVKRSLLVVTVLWLAISSAWASAEEPELSGSHPQKHVVVKGDTLWDISEKFLANPWMWPEIWHANPQVDNSHLIFPGDIIKLVYIDGKPRLVVEGRKYKMSPTTIKLVPSVRIRPLDEAISTIPLDQIEQFLSRSRVVQTRELDAAPYALMGEEERLIVGAGDSMYARGDFSDGVKVYGVYRRGQRFVDPQTGELLGLQALDIGTVKVKAIADEVATLDVTRTTEEIRIGDRLLPYEQRSIESTFFPSAPEEDINGVIMAVEGGLTNVGRMDVVVINRGDREGLEVGNVLAIYQQGALITDRIGKDKVRLPDEKSGLLMVFRTFEKMSFALVLEAERPLHVSDFVRNP
jgi:nucleoid-associated protein YgaU